MSQEGFRRKRVYGINERPDRPVTIEIDENVER
jgi:hypothetical protein